MTLADKVKALTSSADLTAELPPSRTALLVIDVQDDFAAPDGLMGRAGLDLSCVSGVVARTEALLAAARAKGAHVVFIRVVTTPETDSAAAIRLCRRRGLPEGYWEVGRKGAPGANYYRLSPQDGELDVPKTLYNAFHKTGLDEELRSRGVTSLVVTGLTSDCCVDATVRDAFHRDFDVFLPIDACGAYDPDAHTAALAALSNCALLVTSQGVLEAWA